MSDLLTGKVVFITGGTAGLGEQTILALAKRRPAAIYFTGRNEASASQVIQRATAIAPEGVQVTFLRNDISSLASVQELVKTFLDLKPERLDVLMCNAGVMATAPALSPEGYETQFATNHLGHAMLIKHLLPLLQATQAKYGDARIINLTSIAHNLAPKEGFKFDTLKTTQEDMGTQAGAAWGRYGQAKLANMLYADELARHYPNLLCIPVHPGIVETTLISNMSFGRRLGMKFANFGKTYVKPEEGAKSQVWAATAPKGSVKSGVYYAPVGVEGKREGSGKDAALAKKLYEWTQAELDAFESKA